MRGAIAMTAVLLGCGANSALEIVVEMPPGDTQIVVDRVQLYVGLGSHENDTSELLVPRDYTYPDQPSGFYWKRDPNGEQDVVDVAPGASDVRFVFREGTHDEMTAIVVGYKSGSIVAATALVEAYLEPGSVRQYHVLLKPASAAFPRPTARPITVHRWGPGPMDTQCAYLEDSTIADHPSIFIVEHDDRDCDGLVVDEQQPANNLECRPDVYQGMRRPARELTTCLRTDIIPNGPEAACVLGGPGCVDGRGKGTCDPSTACVTPQTCTTCAARTDALDCMANSPAANAAATRIECTFYAVGINGNFQSCPGAAPLTPKFSFTPMCNVEEDFWFWATGQDKWVAQTFAKAGLTFTASDPTASCDFKLGVAGTTVGMTLPETLRSVVSIQIANGRSAALPIAITMAETTDCADAMTKNECHIAGDVMPAPSFLACMQARVVEPW